MKRDWLKRGFKLAGTAWAILGVTLVLLLMIELGLRGLFTLRDRWTRPLMPDPRVIAEGYGGERWPVQHFREIEQLEDRWQPYVYFRQKPFEGETIWINSDGLRRTLKFDSEASTSSCKPAKILMLGGSSLWGYGARDDRTIPSLLAKQLAEHGIPAEIRNLSEIGYVSTQETVALMLELQKGYRPDLVIFYDGVNDTTAAVLEGEVGVTTNEINRRREFNLLQSPERLTQSLLAKLAEDSGSVRFARSIRERFIGPSDSHQGARVQTKSAFVPHVEVVKRYASNIDLVERLGKEYGFRALFYWQPVIFDKPKLTPVESEEAARFAWAEPTFRAVAEVRRASAQLRVNPNFHDLSDQVATIDSLFFIDYCHTTERANEQLTSTIAAHVESLLKASPVSMTPK